MPIFLYSATDPSGRSTTGNIEAATVSAARYKLELNGFREIVFHTDDFSARIDEGLEDPDFPPVDEVLTPKQQLEARRSGGVLREIWFAFKANAIFWVPIAAWNAFNLWQGFPFRFFDWVAVGFAALFLAFFVWLVLPGVAFQKLLEGSVWCRWNEVRTWVRFIRFLKRISPIPIPEFELDVRVAYAMAAEGNLDEALALMRKHEDGPSGKYNYLTRISSVYEAAQRYHEMADCRRKALEHGTGNPVESLDLAMGYVRRLRDPSAARKALPEIDEDSISELPKMFLAYCRGLIALEEKNWPGAEALFRKALQTAAPMAQNVLVDGMSREIKAHLAIAVAHQNRKDEARRLFRQAESMLKARKEDALLARCREAL